MKKILLILILLAIVPGCRMFTYAHKPMLSLTNLELPEGTPNFQHGFKDGCETALYTRGNIYYRTRYHYTFDPDMIDNSEYMFGHKRGYSYCFTYMSGSGQMNGAADTYIIPKDPPFNMKAGNINNTINYGNLDWGIGGSDGGLNGPWNLLSNSGKATGGPGNGVLSSHPFWGSTYSGYIFGQ